MRRVSDATASKRQRVDDALLALIREHAAAGGIPTNNRFVFYELEQRGQAMKPSPDDVRPNRRRSHGWPPGAADVNDGILRLREAGAFPWGWIIDETRTLTEWAYGDTVLEDVLRRLDSATVSPWGTQAPPLILCESKATAGVLRDVVSEYVCPIAGTGGHAHGFLVTEVAPLLRDNGRCVIYLGDLDKSGIDIEDNTRRVLERWAERSVEWTRIGMTAVLAREHGIAPIWKVDGRDRQGRWAIEVEALGQAQLVRLVRETLDALLPESLARVLEREQQERAIVRAHLEALAGAA